MPTPATDPVLDPPRAANADDGDLAARMRRTGRALGDSLAEVVAGVEGVPRRPAELSRVLGLNRDIAGRVMKSIAARDGLEVLHVAPGPEPLRTFIRAAARRGAAPDAVAGAEIAIDHFDRIIRDDVGTRSALDAMIVASLPEARERFELASKQSVFKGMSQLKGVHADVWLNATLIHPAAADPLHHDALLVHGAIGLQRVRPDIPVTFTYREFDTAGVRDDASDASNADAPDWRRLDAFCPHEPARLSTRRVGDVLYYALDDDRVGPAALSDMLVIDHHPATVDRFAAPSTESPPRNRKGTFCAPDIPVRSLVFDAILHESAFPGSDPHLAVYDMGPDGMAYVNDPRRDVDRMDVLESVEFLGQDLRRFHAPEMPRYTAMLEHICQHRGWDPAAFRGYRCRIQYPVHGWQVCMSFDPPAPPAAAT